MDRLALWINDETNNRFVYVQIVVAVIGWTMVLALLALVIGG